MKGLVGLALLLGACAPVGTPPPAAAVRVIPFGPEPDRTEWAFDRSAVEYDLLATARARLGEPLVRRALASNAYIFAKTYPGMRPPPPPDAGPNWRYPLPPFALLFHEKGQWLSADPSGVRPAHPQPIAAIRRILADPGFWRLPASAPPGCTDAGAGLLLLKIPRHQEIARRGTCGDTELTQRLVSIAIDA
jgi:hypothetical protein